MSFDIEQFREKGFVVLKSVLDPNYIEEAKKALEGAIAKEVEYHGGRDYQDYGMVLNCALYGEIFWDLFDNKALVDALNLSLTKGCIVYAYTSSSMPPQRSNYSRRIHVDCPRHIPGYVTNVGATLALDAFTEKNGATRYLPYSQHRLEAPSDEEFLRDSYQFIAAPGDVCIFNARVWHMGGDNVTNAWRHALTVNMCHPWMKQRLDIPKSLTDVDTTRMSAKARQKLGFDAQVPGNYQEYYLPKSERLFKQDTE